MQPHVPFPPFPIAPASLAAATLAYPAKVSLTKHC